MFKKTITYTDYSDVVRTEDFFFNLTKAEVVELETRTKGGLQKMIQKIVGEQDYGKIVEIFKEIILRSYGEKSLDGKHFTKSKDLADAFSQTEAYSEMFMEMASNADVAAAFVNGIVPKDIAAPQDFNKPEPKSPIKIPQA